MKMTSLVFWKNSTLSEFMLKQEQIVNGVRKLVSLLIKLIFKEPLGRFLFEA